MFKVSETTCQRHNRSKPSEMSVAQKRQKKCRRKGDQSKKHFFSQSRSRNFSLCTVS